ncbi:MAG TPA: alpha/beta fold hydrolase [Roseiflexaceae bacterium]|nr:alpha/beta fold hydrolase [Roseiflexaceae bacterium]HMP38748.1 alpha/beta fold hydrolase [Roseiflexaceae bacterium]
MPLPLLLAPAALLAAPLLLTPLRERLTPRELVPAGRFVTVGGYELHYTDEGSPDAPVILCIHGFAASTFTWRAQRHALTAAGWRVIALDLLGYGASARPMAAVYTTRTQADMALGLLDALGIDQAHLAGHSFGARVALQCAMIAPQRIRSLVVICPEAFAAQRPPIGALAALPLVGQALAFYTLAPPLVGLGLRSMSRRYTWLTAEAIAGYAAPLMVRGSAMAQVWQARSPKDGIPAVPAGLATITCPTLVIWGADDPVFPADHGRQLAALLPAAQLVILPDTGHLPHEEEAEPVSHAMLAFLK